MPIEVVMVRQQGQSTAYVNCGAPLAGPSGWRQHGPGRPSGRCSYRDGRRQSITRQSRLACSTAAVAAGLLALVLAGPQPTLGGHRLGTAVSTTATTTLTTTASTTPTTTPYNDFDIAWDRFERVLQLSAFAAPARAVGRFFPRFFQNGFNCLDPG